VIGTIEDEPVVSREYLPPSSRQMMRRQIGSFMRLVFQQSSSRNDLILRERSARRSRRFRMRKLRATPLDIGDEELDSDGLMVGRRSHEMRTSSCLGRPSFEIAVPRFEPMRNANFTPLSRTSSDLRNRFGHPTSPISQPDDQCNSVYHLDIFPCPKATI
jgi:hypothetical protein